MTNLQPPQSQGKSGEHLPLTYPQDWGNRKGLLTVGRNSVRPEDVEGIQERLHTLIQVLSDLKNSTAAAHEYGAE